MFMMSLDEMYKTFPNNQACLTYIFHKNYKDPTCPRCGRRNSFHFAKLTKRFVCTCGTYSISSKKGTLFERSGTDLTKWFLAIYLIANDADGINSLELKNKMGVEYHTALKIRRKIMQLILDHTESSVTHGQMLRVMSMIRKKHSHIPKDMERMYAAEYLYRENDTSADPFLALLDLAIQPQSTPLPNSLS